MEVIPRPFGPYKVDEVVGEVAYPAGDGEFDDRGLGMRPRSRAAKG